MTGYPREVFEDRQLVKSQHFMYSMEGDINEIKNIDRDHAIAYYAIDTTIGQSGSAL